MKREVNNSRQCIECGVPVPRRVKRCPLCHTKNLKTRARYERTPEHKEKMSGVLKGKTHSWDSGSKKPEVAEKIRQSWTPEKREAARARGLVFATDIAWRDLIARSVTGELNPNYQAKGKDTPYAPGWGRLHKRLIRERDGNCCTSCGKSGRLDIHHKDFSKDNHHPDNLVSLCRSCHKTAHYNTNHQDLET
jgi:hypothetical protein